MVRRKQTTRDKNILKNSGSVSKEQVNKKQPSKKRQVKKNSAISKSSFVSFVAIEPVTSEDLKKYVDSQKSQSFFLCKY